MTYRKIQHISERDLLDLYYFRNEEDTDSQRDKTRCASFISLSRRSPHTNTSHSAAAHCSRKKSRPSQSLVCSSLLPVGI